MRIRNYNNNSHAINMMNYEKEFEKVRKRLEKYQTIKNKSGRSSNRLNSTEAKYNELWERIYIPF